MPSGMPLGFSAIRTHIWLILGFLSSTSPRDFSAEFLPSQSFCLPLEAGIPSQQRICHFSLLLLYHTSSQAVCHLSYKGAPGTSTSNLLLLSENFFILDNTKLWRISTSTTTVHSLLLIHNESFLLLFNVLASLSLREKTG